MDFKVEQFQRTVNFMCAYVTDFFIKRHLRVTLSSLFTSKIVDEFINRETVIQRYRTDIQGCMDVERI